MKNSKNKIQEFQKALDRFKNDYGITEPITTTKLYSKKTDRVRFLFDGKNVFLYRNGTYKTSKRIVSSNGSITII